MEELDNFLVKELTTKTVKVLAIKLRKLGYPYGDISTLLNVEAKRIKNWEGLYNCYGLKGLNTRPGTNKGYLKPEEELEVIQWIKSNGEWNIEDLKSYILENYKLKYSSNVSYYSLLHKAEIKPPQKRKELCTN
jgi:transposase